MARVRSRGNRSTEIRLIEIFRKHGIKGWRRHPSLFGSPDFVFPEARVAVFVDGCFWHACPLHGRIPDQNRDFWKAKLERNKRRDRLVRRTLKNLDWRVMRLWQHDLRHPEVVVRRVRRALAS